MHAESPSALEPDEVQPDEVLVTFVHGTWGRGVFPALRISKKPFWSEQGGSFRDNLLSELRGRVVCSFDAFLWSGANSIRHRDQAAIRLAQQLADNLQKHPTIHQVVIAHSHGGNVAAHALGHLGFDSTLQVCYLATPFVQLARRKIREFEPFVIALTVFFLLVWFSPLPALEQSARVWGWRESACLWWARLRGDCRRQGPHASQVLPRIGNGRPLAR
jgi:hypothetical protein